MAALLRSKVFHLTGSRKKTARQNVSKKSAILRTSGPDVRAKFQENETRKFWDNSVLIWLISPGYGVAKQTFRKYFKSNSKFFEKSTSPNGNFRGTVAPLLLEIELRWIPNFCLRISSPTRWWNNFSAISYRFWDRHFGLVFFSEKNWKCHILGACGSRPI